MERVLFSSTTPRPKNVQEGCTRIKERHLTIVVIDPRNVRKALPNNQGPEIQNYFGRRPTSNVISLLPQEIELNRSSHYYCYDKIKSVPHYSATNRIIFAQT